MEFYERDTIFYGTQWLANVIANNTFYDCKFIEFVVQF